jgi:pyridoxamine 5'-phosphate oxidase
MDISDLRREYRYSGVSRKNLLANPVEQFSRWFEEARAAGLQDPNAMILATVSADGQPSQRTVLLKYYDHRGFVFFTNLESKKARQIATNARVSLLFPWLQFERQAIVEGTAERISAAESMRYFMTRPHDSQLAAWVSNQSQPLSSRQMLLQKFDEIKRKFAKGEVPMPSFWGGYRVAPRRLEFWQGRESRLHDRFEYTPDASGNWSIERLAP